jgi:hypothetical protein
VPEISRDTQAVGPAFGPIVDQVVTAIEVLMVGQDEPLEGSSAEMPLHPEQLVRPGRRVLPRRGGQHVGVEQLRQLQKRVDRAWHGVHEREDAGDVVFPALVLAPHVGRDALEPRREVNEHAVHVDVEDLLHVGLLG